MLYLAFFLTLLFFGAFLVQRKSEQGRLSVLTGQELSSREDIFDKVIKLVGSSLETLAFDYSYWDEMVNFVITKEKKWAEQNIDMALGTFKANAAWVYDANNAFVYSVNDLKDPGLQKLPIVQTDLSKLFIKEPSCHFFTYTSKGLMEIRGFFIQATEDAARKTPARGYFFCGRLWDDDYVKYISGLTRTHIIVVDLLKKDRSGAFHPGEKSIRFSRTLNGFDNQPLAYLDVCAISRVIEETKRLSLLFSVFFFFFLVVTLVIFLSSITFWIIAPLRSIALALKEEDFRYIEKLEKNTSELGIVAGLIHKFFIQNEELDREILERKSVEREIVDSKKRYEDLFNNTRSGVAVYVAQNNGEDFVFVNINASCERISHVNREQVVGRSVLQIFPAVKEIGLFKVFQQVWRTGEPQYHPASFYQDGRISQWVDNYIYKLPSGEIVAVYDDITERKQMEEENLKHTHELEIFYKASMGREQRIIELKKEIEELKEGQGK
jgi:PAS domain S-box-containing protein